MQTDDTAFDVTIIGTDPYATHVCYMITLLLYSRPIGHTGQTRCLTHHFCSQLLTDLPVLCELGQVN